MAATLELAPRDEVGDPGPRGVGEPHAPQLSVRGGLVSVLVPAVLMLVVGFVGLDRHSVWRDEAASLVAARRSLPDLWVMLTHTEVVHALYYTFLHAWLQLGTGEAWARVPSVVALAVAAGLVGALGARLVSLPTGLLAGLLFVANPSVSFYAQEARSTALVAALALLATWFLLQAVERRGRWWVAYAVACVVLVALNVLALLVPLAHGVTLLWWRRPRRALRWAWAVVPAGAVALGLGVVATGQTYQIGWIPRPGLSSVRDLAHLLLGPTHVLLVLGAALVVAGLWPSRSPVERRFRALVVPMLVLPSALLLAVSLVQPVFVPRYVFPSVAAAALVAALGAGRLARLAARAVRARGRAAAAVVVVISVAVVLAVAGLGLGAQRFERTAASRPDDLGGAAALVASHAKPGDAVVFLPDNRRLVELAYPQQFVGVRDLSLGQDPVATGNLTGRSLPVPVVLANLDDVDRVWAIGRPGLELLPTEENSRAELDRLRRDFVATTRAGADGVDVVLFVRRAA